MVTRMVRWVRELLEALFDARRTYPVRDSERAATWFTSRCMFGKVSFEHKRFILAVVFDELRRSEKEFGLRVEPEHAYAEEWFFLYVVHRCGGIEVLREVSFEQAHKYISEEMLMHFTDTLQYYFEKEKGGTGSRLKYQCHLEAVRDRLLQEIFNTPIQSSKGD